MLAPSFVNYASPEPTLTNISLIDVTKVVKKSNEKKRKTASNHFEDYLALTKNQNGYTHQAETMDDLLEEDITFDLFSKFSDYITKYLSPSVTSIHSHWGYISGLKKSLELKFPSKINEQFVKQYNSLRECVLEERALQRYAKGPGRMVNGSKVPTEKQMDDLYEYLIRNGDFDYRAFVTTDNQIGGRCSEVSILTCT